MSMSNTNHLLFLLFVFVFAFALLTAPHSIHAQCANTIAASTHLRSPGKRDDSVLAQHAIASLERLKADVHVYRSYGEFESDGRLARVPLESFTKELNQVTAEVESILSQMADAKLKSHLRNALYSYRDGAFWWAKADHRKVVTTAGLRADFATTMPAERFFAATAPYTVVIHWRQASRYLLRAQRLMTEANPRGPTVQSSHDFGS